MFGTNVSTCHTPISRLSSQPNKAPNTHHLLRKPELLPEQLNIARERERVRVLDVHDVRALRGRAVRVDPVHRERAVGPKCPERGFDVAQGAGCGAVRVWGALGGPRGDCRMCGI